MDYRRPAGVQGWGDRDVERDYGRRVGVHYRYGVMRYGERG